MPLGTRPHAIEEEHPEGGNGGGPARDLERRAMELLRTIDDDEPLEAPPPLPLERAQAIDFHVHVLDPTRNVVSLARLAHKGLNRLLRALPLSAPALAHDPIG